MKVTVCELPDNRKAFESAWEELVIFIRKQQSDLVLLPELPFSSWFARTPQFDAQVWQRAQQEHDVMESDGGPRGLPNGWRRPEV